MAPLHWECVLNSQPHVALPRRSIKLGKPQSGHCVRPRAMVSDHLRRMHAHQRATPTMLHTLCLAHNPLLLRAAGFHHHVTVYLLELARGRVPAQLQDPTVTPHAMESNLLDHEQTSQRAKPLPA